MITLFDIHNNVYKIDTTTDNISVVRSKKGFPHWIWLIGWALLFWPACFVWGFIGCTRKYYDVSINGNIVTLNIENYIKLGV